MRSTPVERRENGPFIGINILLFYSEWRNMSKKQVQDYFDTNWTDYLGDTRDTVSSIIESIAPPEPRVLDVGCGSGKFILGLTERGVVESGVGFDISQGMLPDEDTSGVKFFQASATSIPIRSGTFDIATINDVLHHLVGPSRAESRANAVDCLREALHSVDDSGFVVITEQFYEGPVGNSSLTAQLVFWALNRFDTLASYLDQDAVEGLRVSFYTREELRDIIREAGGSIESTTVSELEDDSILRKILIQQRGRIHFVVSNDA
jgi:SAM-dependent methyltransferase